MVRISACRLRPALSLIIPSESRSARETVRVSFSTGVSLMRAPPPRISRRASPLEAASPARLKSSKAGMPQASRPRGTVIMKSTVHGLVPVDTAPLIVNEITLVGSRCGRFEAALPLLAGGGIRVEEMIAARYALREAPQAFARAAARGTLKVLLTA